MQRDYHAQIAHHYRMNKVHGYILTRYRQLCFPLVHYMLSAVMQGLHVHVPTCWSDLYHYVCDRLCSHVLLQAVYTVRHYFSST